MSFSVTKWMGKRDVFNEGRPYYLETTGKKGRGDSWGNGSFLILSGKMISEVFTHHEIYQNIDFKHMGFMPHQTYINQDLKSRVPSKHQVWQAQHPCNPRAQELRSDNHGRKASLEYIMIAHLRRNKRSAHGHMEPPDFSCCSPWDTQLPVWVYPN